MENLITSLLSIKKAGLLDCRIPNDQIESSFTTNILRQKNLISKDETVFDFNTKVLRILLNPAPHILNNFIDFSRSHFKHKTVLGIQIRTGGCVANFHELKSMMSLQEIRQFPSFINSVISKELLRMDKTVVFLSTDSDLVEEYIREQLNSDIEIITANIYKRSHSRGKANEESVSGALLDTLLLARADVLITCSGSGFGRVANTMSLSRRKYIYNTTHTLTKLYNKRLRKCTDIPIL